MTTADHTAEQNAILTGRQPVTDLSEQCFRKTSLFHSENTAWEQAPLDDLADSVETKSTEIACTPINRDQNSILRDCSIQTDLPILQAIISSENAALMMTLLIVLLSEFVISSRHPFNVAD
jgi:hypothetical protein